MSSSVSPRFAKFLVTSTNLKLRCWPLFFNAGFEATRAFWSTVAEASQGPMNSLALPSSDAVSGCLFPLDLGFSKSDRASSFSIDQKLCSMAALSLQPARDRRFEGCSALHRSQQRSGTCMYMHVYILLLRLYTYIYIYIQEYTSTNWACNRLGRLFCEVGL